MPTTTLCFPQRPFRLVDAINRMSLATGSTRTAQQAAGADYNGHRVEVSYSSYRNAWSASYTWAGTCWLARMTTFDQALDAAFREHDRGALGSEIRVDCQTDEQAKICCERGLIPMEEAEALKLAWKDARFAEVNGAIELDRRSGIPATAFLLRASTVEEYTAMLEAHRVERRVAKRSEVR